MFMKWIMFSFAVQPLVAPLPRPPLFRRRECKCMFCHKTFVFSSQDEAVAHMSTCPGLETQMGNEQHTFDVDGMEL